MKRLGTMILVVCCLTLGHVSAQTPQARLTVEVRNNTANGAPVASDEVALHLYRGQQQIDVRPAKVGEDGKAVFENVSTGQDISAVARVKHQNMFFRSRPVPLNSAAGEFSANVQVFDVSNDASKLSVGTHHLMVALRGEALEFTEYLQLKNSSDKAVIGSERDAQDRPVVVRFVLPEGFRDLAESSYLEPEALVITEEGFYDTLAVPPGEHQVAFSYKLDLGRGATRVAKEITLPTSQLMIFWEHGQGALEGLGEPSNRLTSAASVPIEYYRRSNLQPGDRITFRISGFNAKKKSDASTWIILGVVFAVIVIVALLRMLPKPTESGQTHG